MSGQELCTQRNNCDKCGQELHTEHEKCQMSGWNCTRSITTVRNEVRKCAHSITVTSEVRKCAHSITTVRYELFMLCIPCIDSD